MKPILLQMPRIRERETGKARLLKKVLESAIRAVQDGKSIR